MHDRRPGLIIRCSGVADVINGVNLGREQKLFLAVRSGGHQVRGHGTTDGGLLLDLRDMNGVWVDVENRRVRCRGGATWGQVDREAQLLVPTISPAAVLYDAAAGEEVLPQWRDWALNAGDEVTTSALYWSMP